MKMFFFTKLSKLHNIHFLNIILMRQFRPSFARTSCKVPVQPTWDADDNANTPSVKIEDEMIHHLERLSLVDFGNKEGIDRLSSAVTFADKIDVVDTNGVEPMDTVLEERWLYLRKDEVIEGNCRQSVLCNAAQTYHEYYISPPGNVPIQPRKPYLASEGNEHGET